MRIIRCGGNGDKDYLDSFLALKKMFPEAKAQKQHQSVRRYSK